MANSELRIANSELRILTIDGSYGEGGGQVVRTSLALAAITGQAVRIERIRAGRKKPGLRPQHLTGVRAASAICGARLEGAELGSRTLTFVPGGPVQPGQYIFDVADAARGGSAGSVGLVLQTVLLPLALTGGESYLTLRGGTHVAWAPSISYLEHVFLPMLARMGAHAQVELTRWGFYPTGGGEIQVRIAGIGQGGLLMPIQLAGRGELQKVWGTAAVMNLPAHIPQRMANRARNVLGEAGLEAHVEPRRLRGTGPGAGIFLFAQYGPTSGGAGAIAGFTAYGRRGLPAERVAEAACRELVFYHRSGAPVDPYLADQLVLPMVLAGTDRPQSSESQLSVSQVSQHLLTNIWAVRQFITAGCVNPTKIDVVGELGAPGTITVRGGHD